MTTVRRSHSPLAWWRRAASAAARRARAFLVQTLDGRHARNPQAVANALAATGLPEAAELLGRRYQQFPEAHGALVVMGDTAVPVVARLASSGVVQALDGLQQIATPTAAGALVPLLWRDPDQPGEQLAYRAAWRLAVLLRDTTVCSALDRFPLTSEQAQAPFLSWLWKPFAQPGNGASLEVIAGRVGHCCVPATWPLPRPTLRPSTRASASP